MVVLSYNGAGMRFFAGWTTSIFGAGFQDVGSTTRLKFTNDAKLAIAFLDRRSAQKFLDTCPFLGVNLGITEFE